ncbi:hypothetical protein FPZ12_045345 [Amycolatopsis acidicola]|uniref:TetR/AcrR family transcriptional regulator n=1 Tax=Amycolatopsis acidicola TaxID=2596893 RepID=A0A5N0UGZ0_9PSEU|nr:hypothetical protein [Amycolatopsis acidicola]KAA9147623.1 hypothetical protein FPZ12_045345 [Amycolatopsis acidicola]
MVSPEQPAVRATVDQVTEAAVELARTSSLAACTFFGVSAVLRLTVAELRRVVPTDDELIALVLKGIAGRTLEGMPEPDSEDVASWRHWPLMFLGNVRAVLLAHGGTARPMYARIKSGGDPGPQLVNRLAAACTHGGLAPGWARVAAVDVLTEAVRLIAAEDSRRPTYGEVEHVDGARRYGEVLRTAIDLFGAATPVADAPLYR